MLSVIALCCLGTGGLLRAPSAQTIWRVFACMTFCNYKYQKIFQLEREAKIEFSYYLFLIGQKCSYDHSHKHPPTHLSIHRSTHP